MHGFEHAVGEKVTSVVSCTGGFTPSSAVNVAAKIPVVLHTNDVATVFAGVNEHEGLPVDQCTVGVLSGSVTVAAIATGWRTIEARSGPASTVGATFGATTVTIAVSLTGVLKPSEAVSVAAKKPPAVHVIVVTTAVASANEQFGFAVLHRVVGVLSGSVTDAFNVIGVFVEPETSGPALTVGGRLPTTVTMATSYTGLFTPSSAVSVAVYTPAVVH